MEMRRTWKLWLVLLVTLLLAAAATDAQDAGACIAMAWGSPDLNDVQIEQWHHNIGTERGVKVTEITTTQLTVQAGNDKVAYYPDNTGTDYDHSTGHYRVLAMRID